MLIVGSHALAHFGYNRNPPKDNDLWFSQNGLEEFNSFNEHIVIILIMVMSMTILLVTQLKFKQFNVWQHSTNKN